MTKERLNQKEQHYASTYEHAEEIVFEAKKSTYLTKQQITEKHNKFGTYFVVDLTFTYNVPKEIMENVAVQNEAERIVHEGIEVKKNSDGTIEVDPNQTNIDEFIKNDGVPF